MLACFTGPAQAQIAIPENQWPARVIASDRQVEANLDGSWTAKTHLEIKILSPNAIPALGQPALGYRDQMQQLDISNAYTLKADGRKLAVAPDAILTRQNPASANSPLLSDQKQKVILFPNVEQGDTLVYDSIITSKPEFDGSFIYTILIPTSLPVDRDDVTVSVPRAMAPAIEVHGLSAATSTQGDRVVYAIHFSNSRPVRESLVQSAFDVAPRFSVSTFKDYDAFAATYAKLALGAMTVTPEIQAKADEITAGVNDRRAQAKKIYDWVATHVRYVEVELGQGGIVPHDADRVLANAYGDCKDYAVLFGALLKAKGIDSNLVLVNSTSSFTRSKVPAVIPFNHMIVWLPEFRLYADATNGRFVPFGLLPPSEYGKPAVHIGDRSGALHNLPLSDPAASGTTYKLVLTTDDAGHITSNSSLTATGNFATTLRLLGGLMQGQNGSAIANAILQRNRVAGANGTLTLPPIDIDAASYQVSASYSTAGVVDGIARDEGLALFDNLRLLGPFSGAFFGPLLDNRGGDEAAVPCYNGHAVDDETLQFPATRHLATLPPDSHVSRPHITYVSHWSTDGNSISVHRELNTQFDQMLCSGSAKDDLLVAAGQIRKDAATVLLLPHVAGGPAEPAKP
jgi:transglutaminase-like putative cysteine protease